MIKTIIFDMGGVIITLDPNEALRRFAVLGMNDFVKQMDPYTQGGIFGELEEGKLSEEEYRQRLSEICGRTLSYEEIQHSWMGYMKEVPARNLALLRKLKKEGYRIVLLSNTNPYIAGWTDSENWDGEHHAIQDYFDAIYRSFEVKYMKPNENFFRHVLQHERLLPENALFIDDGPRNCAAASELGIRTFCPQNGADWTEEIYKYLE